MRKRSFLLVAGASLATLSLAAGTALADPVPPQPPFRAIQLVGSDTSQEVMNAYANGVPGGFTGIRDAGNNLLVASWDATGTDAAGTANRIEATFDNTTCNPPGAATLTRPNGSTAGVNALSAGITGFPAACANAARTSNNDSASRPGQNLTYVPFGLDGLPFSTLTQSNVPKNLTEAELDAIYAANGTPGSEACFGFRPLIPQTGSGTRGFWVGLHPVGTCVRDTDPNCVGPGNPTGLIQEHDGCWTGTLGGNNANTKIFPFGTGPWIAQSTNPNVPDRRGTAILREINGLHPFDVSNFDAPHRRPLFNVARNADVGTPNFVRAFGTAAQGGQICSNPGVLRSFGLQTVPDCGIGIPTPPN